MRSTWCDSTADRRSGLSSTTKESAARLISAGFRASAASEGRAPKFGRFLGASAARPPVRRVPARAQARYLRNPEVKQLDGHAIRLPDAKKIGGLEVAVNYPEVVGFGQCLTGLEGEVYSVFDRQRTLATETRREVLTLEIFHHHVRHAAFERRDIRHSGDVFVLDLHRRAGFPLEAHDGLGVVDRVGQEQLDCHALVEFQMSRGHDDAHAADSEDALDEVPTVENVAYLDPQLRLRFVPHHSFECRNGSADSSALSARTLRASSVDGGSRGV